MCQAGKLCKGVSIKAGQATPPSPPTTLAVTLDLSWFRRKMIVKLHREGSFLLKKVFLILVNLPWLRLCCNRGGVPLKLTILVALLSPAVLIDLLTGIYLEVKGGMKGDPVPPRLPGKNLLTPPPSPPPPGKIPPQQTCPPPKVNPPLPFSS